MPSCKPALSPLAAKLDQLNITVEEVAAVCRVPVEVVTNWIENGPDDEGAIRLRWLANDDDADALRRVGQLRRTHVRNMAGDGATQAGVTVPYGTSDIGKTTGGVPS
jgi:hypothetical protein